MKIALVGRMRAGKDEVARILEKEFGFMSFAFGSEIGNVIDRYFPHAREAGKPRGHYQSVGQTFRELNPNVWIEQLAYEMECNSDFKNTLVTDCRQPNEYEWLKSQGFLFIRVHAVDSIRRKRMELAGDVVNEDNLSHETESYVDSFDVDFEINNNGTLRELFRNTLTAYVDLACIERDKLEA